MTSSHTRPSFKEKLHLLANFGPNCYELSLKVKWPRRGSCSLSPTRELGTSCRITLKKFVLAARWPQKVFSIKQRLSTFQHCEVIRNHLLLWWSWDWISKNPPRHIFINENQKSPLSLSAIQWVHCVVGKFRASYAMNFHLRTIDNSQKTGYSLIIVHVLGL